MDSFDLPGIAEPYPGATHEEWEACINRLQQHIAASSSIPDELKPVLISRVSGCNEFLEIVTETPNQNYHFQIGQLGWKYWAIRNDSLKLLESLSPAAIAITTFMAVPAAAPAVLAVSLLFGAVALSDRLRNKSAPLEHEQYYVLMTLKAAGPSSPEDLAEKLGGIHLFGRGVWSTTRTLEALQALQSIRLRDGSSEALVTQAHDGRWSTNGI